VNYKLIILTPIIILLIILSGCIHLLSTAEREACLSATHFSTNSIDVCETQRECYNKQSTKFEISNELPISIYNNNIIYLNNIASATYNFNQSTKYLKELNKSCDIEDVNKIVKTSNDLFVNLRNIFEYIDRANAESIILIKDYAIYLESEGIEEIPEEEIYQEYIELNNNLNELRVDSKNENYIHLLLEESARLNVIAEDFGFKKNYISNINYIDLTAYYLKLIEDPSGEIRVPTIVPGLNYVLGELSKLEQLKNITLNLQRADNYNFYITLDRFIGEDDSLFTEFKERNTKINNEIDKVHTKIENLETEIEENYTYLSQDSYFEFHTAKINFREKKNGFGTYLSLLKKINNELNQNKINEQDQNDDIFARLKDCEETIKIAEEINNIYLNKLIKKYKTETNLKTKESICNQIMLEINNPSCLIDLENLLELGTIEFEEYRGIYLDNITQKECIDIVNNINNQLENNEKIKIIKQIILDNRSKITEIQQISVIDFEKKIILVDINSKASEIEGDPNYKLYFNIDTKIKEQQKLNTKLIEIAKEIEEEYLQKEYEIKLVDSNTYLILTNIFSFELNDIEIKLNDQLFKINSLSPYLDISGNKLLIGSLFSNKNYFRISIENEKEITTQLIKLDLENTLFETIIKNQVVGINDKLYIYPNQKLVTGVVDEQNYFNYITEKENRVLFTQDILNNTIISNKFDKITTDKYTNIIELKIKNNYVSSIVGELKLIEVDESIDEYVIYVLKVNNREQKAYYQEGGIYTIINLDKGEEKIYQLQTMYGFDEITSIAKEYLLEMNRLENTYFIDLKKEAISNFSSIDSIVIDQDITIDKIQLIFNKENKINELTNKEKKCVAAENAFFVLYAKLSQLDLSVVNKTKLEKINSEKYTNIIDSLKKLQTIENNYNKEKEKQTTEIEQLNLERLQELKMKVSEYNINDDELDKLIMNADYMNEMDLNLIEEKIEGCLKLQTTQINNIVLELEEIEQSYETDTLDKIKWMFEDFSLDELYAQEYYPGITIADIKRYEKKQSFLDTQKLKTEITEFKQKFAEKEYEGAKNAISNETLSRIEDIISENAFINEGFFKIKTDAKDKLNEYIENNNNSQKAEIKENITLGKEYYANGKYLNAMVVLKEVNQKAMKSNQILIIATILFILLLLGTYYGLGKKKKKQMSHQERKRRVIRHN